MLHSTTYPLPSSRTTQGQNYTASSLNGDPNSDSMGNDTGTDTELEIRRLQTNHGVPDVAHDDVAAEVPGAAFDTELERIHDIEGLYKVETRSSARAKLGRALSKLGSRKSTAESRRGGMKIQRIPVSELEKGIVGWDGQDDPAMPFNKSNAHKWLLVLLVSAMTFATPFTSSILSPGIASMDRDFHNTNSMVGSLAVSIYLLGYVIGPLFLAPLSEIYGRRPVLTICNIFYCVWQIGCALAPNMTGLIVFRLLAGIGGSAALTLGGGVVGDVFRAHERGFAMGVWNIGPSMGPAFGPLVGGFIAETIGWRWQFWVCLILGAVLTGLLFVFSEETNHRVLIQRKVRRLRAELGRHDLRSCYVAPDSSEADMSMAQIVRSGLVRPAKMLVLSPMLLALSLYVSFVYGVMYLLFTTIPPLFEKTYGFSVGLTGLVYLAIGFGNLFGWAVYALFADKLVVKLAAANGGVFEPEMRLAASIAYGFFLPVTFFWYGWVSYYKKHWMAAIMSLVPFGFGITGLFVPAMTYLVDAYPMYAASAIAGNMVLRSLAGTLLPLAGPKLYDSLGYGWGNSLLGFISAILIPVPLLIYRYGAKLRAMQKFTL